MTGKLVDVAAVNLRREGVEKRVFAADHVAMRFERLPQLAAVPRLHGDDDVLRRGTASQRFPDEAVNLRAMTRSGVRIRRDEGGEANDEHTSKRVHVCDMSKRAATSSTVSRDVGSDSVSEG